MKTVKGLIIHLKRAHDRLEQVNKLQEQLPIETHIVDAVDSLELNEQRIQSFYVPKLQHPHYPFALSKNEIACFLSHRKAWQTIVDEKLKGALILEDDVFLEEDFDKALSFALANLRPESFIRFPFREREHGKMFAQDHGFRLIKPQQVGLGQVAQLVGYEAAATLLKATEKFDRPVDTTMQLYWQTKVHPMLVLPPVVKEISAQLGGSTIKSQRGFLSKLYRELARPLYRKKIAFLSSRQEQ